MQGVAYSPVQFFGSTSKLRLKLPSFETIKDEVFSPSLAFADQLSDYVLMPFVLFFPPLLVALLYIVGFKELSTAIENVDDSIRETASLFADEVGDLSYRHHVFAFAVIEQCVQLIRERGGMLLNLIFNLIKMFPLLVTFLLFSIVGLVVSLFVGDIKQSKIPNQGLREALKTALSISVLFSTASIITYQTHSFHGKVLSCFLGFLVCTSYLPLTKHFCLRIILTRNRIIPWNFARFLNYCTERRLLQRIGGRYRFLHRELLDYFANLRV